MEKLELYALYKQAVSGDVTGSQPGMINFVARAKYDAHAKLKGMSKEEAMQGYIQGTASLAGSEGAASEAGSSVAQERKIWPAFEVEKRRMLPDGAFEGKVCVVTGGGTGLGRGMATTLSALGGKVVIMSRRLEVLEATAAEIEAETGNKVYPIALNVRDGDMVVEAMDQLEREVGIPDVVINNAAGNFIAPR